MTSRNLEIIFVAITKIDNFIYIPKLKKLQIHKILICSIGSQVKLGSNLS
jgi:hypothetical protein